ncbi:MAG: hypothetical protein BWY75_00964 [bacterium ADurb.Bin425]|nr:MAG: hypothetical protein BWY75_00964 [bacterium ADurb.Bin425]
MHEPQPRFFQLAIDYINLIGAFFHIFDRFLFARLGALELGLNIGIAQLHQKIAYFDTVAFSKADKIDSAANFRTNICFIAFDAPTHRQSIGWQIGKLFARIKVISTAQDQQKHQDQGGQRRLPPSTLYDLAFRLLFNSRHKNALTLLKLLIQFAPRSNHTNRYVLFVN